MVKYGRRNIACLTIAPTGTTSIMTRTSLRHRARIPPVYKRRRKVNPGDANVHVDFVDEVGDAFEEYIVYHPKFVDWMRINGIEVKEKMSPEEIEELVSRSPYYKATSADVDWMEKVRMQGKVQKWVDHSISVTINLPSDVTEELVDNLYKEVSQGNRWRRGRSRPSVADGWAHVPECVADTLDGNQFGSLRHERGFCPNATDYESRDRLPGESQPKGGFAAGTI